MKSLDEQKPSLSSIPLLFSEDNEEKRSQLLTIIETILLEDFESFGKKIRDILWRKVYYDPITIAKRILKYQKSLNDHDLKLLSTFIKAAITNYKTLILKFEELFSLDLRNVIDFSIIANGSDPVDKKSEKVLYTTNEINHAMETIHVFLVCLGDLHRYCIEFNFADSEISLSKSKELAAKYYIEAFKFNPKIGMPHNQLGTLKAGENYEINSIFHYIYSLCSPFPFELSETNVNRVFQQNVEALERNDTVCDGFNVRDFIMQMILVTDIFFYDKEIDDLNTICKTVLISFKEYLSMNRRGLESDDLTFQLTSIFMLCLLKLKQNNSPKVHSLNAFLVAFCAEIVEVSSYKVDTFIADHHEENEKFIAMYEKSFVSFEKQIRAVKGSRRNQNNSCSEPNGNGTVSGGSSQRDEKLCGTSGGTSTGSSQKNGNHLSVDSGKEMIKIAKKPKNHDRRRRRRVTRKSESEYSSDESDESDSENSMNSDFESDFDVDDERFSTSDDDSDDDDDIVIESEEIVYANGDEKPKRQKENSLSFHGSVEDIVIEEEKIVYAEGSSQHDDDDIHENPHMKRMKYKKKYSKDDPNLILQFHALNLGWMKSLKLLFDWLRVESKLLINCYESNPEFINMIMKLVNYLNIDIFTRKIFFDRSMIKMKNVRENLRYLFDIRHKIATTEDVLFKKFILFEELQHEINWDLNLKLKISHEEDVILRNFKIIDFGFFLCKMKKFRYNFCARSRIFIEKHPKRRERHRDRDGGRRKDSENSTQNNGMKKRRNRRNRRQNRERNGKSRDVERKFEDKKSDEKVEEYPSLEQSHVHRGYLKNKNASAADDIDKKNELMGKLWLKSEIQTLESKKLHTGIELTPYIMLDSKCLTNHLSIVKNLVKSKKFVVLVPQAGKINH